MCCQICMHYVIGILAARRRRSHIFGAKYYSDMCGKINLIDIGIFAARQKSIVFLNSIYSYDSFKMKYVLQLNVLTHIFCF